jgi:hypothetical protein
MDILDYYRRLMGGGEFGDPSIPAMPPQPLEGAQGYTADVLQHLQDVVSGKVAAGGALGQNNYDSQRSFAQNALNPAGIGQATDIAFGIGPGAIRAPRTAVAPSIGRGAEAPLFDYAHLAEVPDVPQFNLERYVPPRGVPERTQALADPANIARVNEVVGRGAKMGGLEWYNTEPLRGAFAEILGEGPGQQAYSRYMDLVASTSPRSKVAENARNASYYYTQAQQGLPVPEPPLPSPYGHLAQRLHVQNARNVLENEGFPVLQNPKPASFSQNLQGNQMPVTVDAHNARLLGMVDSKGRPVDLPSNTEYGFVERLQQEEAAKMGMSPAQYQASAWIGGGEQTGLKSSADPFLKVLEDRVRLTAAKRGVSPQQALADFVKGNLPLLSVGGLAGLGGFGSVPDRTAPAVVY